MNVVVFRFNVFVMPSVWRDLQKSEGVAVEHFTQNKGNRLALFPPGHMTKVIPKFRNWGLRFCE